MKWSLTLVRLLKLIIVFFNKLSKNVFIGLKNALVPVDFIRNHSNAFSKEVCKRIFDGAQIMKLSNLNKPVVAEDVSMIETNSKVEFDQNETNENVIQENLTAVIIILVTSLLSFGLILINLRLLF